jgi:hypothetical protein
MSLKHLNDSELIESTTQALHASRKAEVVVLRHFREIEERRLWTRAGSLYKFLSERFGLTDDQVYPRLQAMRLMNAVPEVEKKLENGDLNMTNALKAQQVFRAESKQRQVTTEERRSVLSSLENISTRKAEKVLAERYPNSLALPEKIKPVSPNQNLIQFYVDDETIREIEDLKARYSHQMPEGKMQDLMKILIKLARKKSNPSGRTKFQDIDQDKHPNISHASAQQVTQAVQSINVQSEARPSQTCMLRTASVSNPSKSRSRYISATVMRELEKSRAQGCTHTDAEGYRCGSLHFLQLDHIVEFRHGGPNEAQNLRWMCGFHNRNRGETGAASTIRKNQQRENSAIEI